ncbi:hypothetical protein CSPAE12_02096, partial [Colletotrichum incanum]
NAAEASVRYMLSQEGMCHWHSTADTHRGCQFDWITELDFRIDPKVRLATGVVTTALSVPSIEKLHGEGNAQSEYIIAS